MSAALPASSAPGLPPLRGRDAELTALRGLLAGARAGSGGALLLVGAAGTGKSALLDVCAAEAADLLVLRARGVACERDLPYAGLHGLLRPLRDRLAALPAAQGEALTEALDLGTPTGRLVVPAAVLTLLSQAAAERPVVAVVDDLHHFDAPSREALLFTARRLAGEPVALLLGARADVWAGAVPVRAVECLDERAAHELTGDLVNGGLPDEVRASLDQIARGNPLALTELALALTPEQLAGTAAPPATLPREGRLWRAYTNQIEDLPGPTRDLLLLLAADPRLDPATLLKAFDGDPFTALEAAERAGIVEVTGERFRFRDPAAGPVVYHNASLLARRAAHRSLAGALAHHRLRRAWHRAAALDGPPEELADELEAAATATGAPCPFPELSLAYERAAELSTRDDTRATRLAAAAQYARLEGRPHRAHALLDRLRSGTISAELRQQAESIRARLELRGGETSFARDELLAVAASLLERDRTMAVRALVRAAEASYLAGDHQRFVVIARDALTLRRDDDPPAIRLMFEYLTGMAESFRGRHAEAAGPLRRVVELAPLVHSPSVLVWAAVSSLMLGDDAQAFRLSTRAVETARALGAVATVPQVLEFAINSEYWLGRYASAAANASEGLRLAQETGQRGSAGQHLGWLSMMAAVQGDEETVQTRARAAIEVAGAHGVSIAGALGNWALAQIDLASGRPAAAVHRLRPTARADVRNTHLVVQVSATPHFVEAAARTGERDQATRASRVFERWAESTGSPDRRALAVRCRALLAPPGAADELFRTALDLHHQGFSEFETARTELLYGSALRRDRRPGAAREHLYSALDTFERYGARLWVDQARSELRAAGEAVRTTRPKAAEELTAQQFQIARMVADGATNREVAAQLYLSPRTVEHHLRNIFAKLDIRSRVDLVRLLT